MGTFLGKKGRIQVFAGRAPSSQTVGSYWEPPGQQSGPKKLGKSVFGEFTSMEKYTQLFFMSHIWHSQKFDPGAMS